MLLLKQIPVKYLAYIPVVYFLLLGIYQVLADLWDGQLTGYHFSFNFTFFIVPAIFRYHKVFMIWGAGLTMLWGYLLFTGLILLADGKPFNSYAETLGVGAFILFSFVCAVSMCYGGHLMNGRKSIISIS